MITTRIKVLVIVAGAGLAANSLGSGTDGVPQ